jgi:hypothetical protein
MHTRRLPATLRFMLAARRSELLGLEDLAQTCGLVTRISQLVHALQKERGYSNVYLGGDTPNQRLQLDNLSQETEQLERQLHDELQRFDHNGLGALGKTRLLTRIAHALHGLDELPRLRRQIRERQISAQTATNALVRLIGNLLTVVFEAADSASDPDITRCLVALFNFMQGKELAGQERALGVIGFANSYFQSELLESLERLVEGQERSFSTFSRFANPTAQDLWLVLCASQPHSQACRLREIARCTDAGAKVAPQLSELWFELHTQRIDLMKGIETHLEQALLHCCQQNMQRIRKELHSHRRLLEGLCAQQAVEQARLFSVYSSNLNIPPEEGISSHLTRSTLELLQDQNLRLQDMHEELREARQALEERKQVDRAKLLLIKQRGCSESEAYAWLRQSAMIQGLRVEKVAQGLLSLDNEPASRPSRPRPRH